MKFNLLKGVGVMSLRNKRRLEKVVLFTAALVAVIVGVVVAQQVASPNPPITEYPYKPGLSAAGNMAQDSEFGTQTLTISVEVDNHASLWAVSHDLLGTADKAAKIDTASCVDPTVCEGYEGILGNAGYLMVETNFAKWDVLVRAKNGGYLKRETLYAGEDPDDPVIERAILQSGVTCVLNNQSVAQVQVGTNALNGAPIMGCPAGATENGNILEEVVEGVYLKGGNINEPLPLRIGVGTIKVGGTTATPKDFNAIANDITTYINTTGTASVTGPAENFAWLDSITFIPGGGTNSIAGTGDRGSVAGAAASGKTASNIASIAKELGTKIGSGAGGTGNGLITATRQAGTGAAAGTVIPGPGSAGSVTVFSAGMGTADNGGTLGSAGANDLNYFRTIDGGYIYDNGAFAGWTEPNAAGVGKYPAMIFYVNAMLGVPAAGDISDAVGGTFNSDINTQQFTPGANRNGKYTEDLIFTFWGVY
jgi:hypothetical protein